MNTRLEPPREPQFLAGAQGNGGQLGLAARRARGMAMGPGRARHSRLHHPTAVLRVRRVSAYAGGERAHDAHRRHGGRGDSGFPAREPAPPALRRPPSTSPSPPPCPPPPPPPA